MQIQSMPDASPIKWHLAHTSWAFETFVLKPQFNHYQLFDPLFEYLFNSYYNTIGKQYPRAKRGLLSHPSIEMIHQYREHVDTAMLNFLDNEKGTLDKEIKQLLILLINHEQQHQELMMTDLKHALFQNPMFPEYKSNSRINDRVLYDDQPLNWIEYSAGLYKIGHQNETFFFDNEGPQHEYYLEGFKMASRLVTNGEYLNFVLNGGYQDPSFWLSEAWGIIEEQKISSPLYWIRKKDQWYQYTLFGLQPLDLNQPAQHISYFEANAFANCVNKRLPTEQEWEIAARSDKNLKQMFNTLWQWTTSSYCAYPGFKIADGAIGEYNGKFMVNQYVLRGGSKVTPENHIRASYRNFFYPNASWQYSGIRLAENL